MNETDDNLAYFVGLPAHIKLPASVDWRQHGAVTHVKDQKTCGSCWTFASTGAIEGQYFLKTGHLLSLSEQNLLDCSTPYGNFGCDGGNPLSAFDYVKASGGIATESSYPYHGFDQYCKYHHNAPGVNVKGFVRIPPNDELKLQEAIATVGPIAVSIDASRDSFTHYSSGIYYDPHCSTTNTDHVVLIVGYGTDEHNQDYYIVKNSWGDDWGENGYIRMARNHHNHCAIALQANYPILDHA